jgi:alkaline phosphatase D
MKRISFFILVLNFNYSLAQTDLFPKIAFGSCAKQYHELFIFDTVLTHQPDLFVFLGDNIYGDTENMDTLKMKYEQLNSKKSFKNLKNNVPIIATWDDHDFGLNDGGKYYCKKEESKQLFLDFFQEPKNSERRKHAGIYTSYYYNYGDKIVQVILLDTRTFRSDLTKYSGEVKDDPRYFYDLDYYKNISKDSTLLGNEQWFWLENELKNKADLRIIGSPTQFGIEYNGYEAWANFPEEQKKMFDLIVNNKIEHVVFISGDVHYGEISKVDLENCYPLYDITSSGLSSKWHFATPNTNRVEGPIMENHFGLITVNWNDKNPYLICEIWDDKNNQRIEFQIRLEDLEFK